MMEITPDLVARILREQGRGGWSVEGEIGRGAFGGVFRVTDGSRQAALKAWVVERQRGADGDSVLSADKRLDDEWKRFADSQHKKLRSAALVGVQDFFRHDLETDTKNARAVAVVLMDHYPANLHDWVMDRFPLSAGEVQRLFEAVVGLVGKLYAETGFLYEDLKPRNVLLETDGTGAVLGDLGGLRNEASSSGHGQFTPDFAAPERLREGRAQGVPSVAYALGLLGYWLAAGHVPYEDDPPLTRAQRLAEEGLPGNDTIADRLAPIRPAVERCLRDDPAARPRTFEAVLAPEPAGGRSTVKPTRGPSPGGDNRRRWRAVAAAAAGLVLLAAGAGAGVWWTTGPAGAPESATTLADTAGDAPATARDTDPEHAPGDTFRDCPECPKMTVVPSGSFRMGSPPSEENRDDNEGPVHEVTIAEPFAVGVYEVTWAQWEACVEAGGCTHEPDDEGWGRGDRPVINVDWEDAREYVDWLSGETGEDYRLLTEAEWEYVARAGTRTRYWWGDGIGDGKAVCYGCGSRWDYEKTAPVGSFSANPWGLHDVHGNVYEWTQDCWHDNYDGAPTDGGAWLEADGGDCSRRVLRGGSWGHYPRDLRSANRSRGTTDGRGGSSGFRVARTL